MSRSAYPQSPGARTRVTPALRSACAVLVVIAHPPVDRCCPDPATRPPGSWAAVMLRCCPGAAGGLRSGAGCRRLVRARPSPAPSAINDRAPGASSVAASIPSLPSASRAPGAYTPANRINDAICLLDPARTSNAGVDAVFAVATARNQDRLPPRSQNRTSEAGPTLLQ